MDVQEPQVMPPPPQTLLALGPVTVSASAPSPRGPASAKARDAAIIAAIVAHMAGGQGVAPATPAPPVAPSAPAVAPLPPSPAPPASDWPHVTDLGGCYALDQDPAAHVRRVAGTRGGAPGYYYRIHSANNWHWVPDEYPAAPELPRESPR